MVTNEHWSNPYMNVEIKTLDHAKVVELEGEIDANTAPELQEKLLPLIEEKHQILLNMIKVPYMSSAGLRMLLLLSRQSEMTRDSSVILAGLSEELRDTMSATGFLDFFTIHDTLENAIAAIQNQ